MLAPIAEIVLFHHAHGLTDGFCVFAEEIRTAGHRVHTPDLYEGRTFPELADGVAYAEAVGFDTIIERGRVAADRLPAPIVYAGCSLGVLPAQCLAQTRPGAQGAVLISACVPPAEFGGPWPPDVPLQIHGMDADPFFAGEGDLEAARALVDTVPGAALYEYPGEQHLFADPSLSDYDPIAAALLRERVLGWLDAIG